MSMVGFNTDDIDAIDISPRRQPLAIDEFPYDGGRCAVIEGPAGEWLELIEVTA
jgi:hypothetical protein